MTETPIVECVPNFSEGRDASVVARLADCARRVPGAAVLDHTMDADHHRSVITLAGAPAAVLDAAVAMAGEAARLIDLRRHTGVHPRVGAMDVLPFVPVRAVTLETCAELAHWAGNRIWLEHGIPVYFYAAAALREECSNLSQARHGAANGTLIPDLGGPSHHPSAGAVLAGARTFLIAYNVNLETTDLAAARRIAALVRESSGGLPAVKALGLPLASQGIVQVSMNLVDFRLTPLRTAYEAVAREAARLGVAVRESELIGLAPAAALNDETAHAVRLRDWDAGKMILENRLSTLESN